MRVEIPRTAGTIRVVIADDDEPFRSLIAQVLGVAGGIDVVGTAADGLEAVDTVRALRPDVVVMDVRMPRMNGIKATEQIVREVPSTRIVMFTAYEERNIVLSVVKAGAHGFVVKGDSISDIERAVRAAAAGRSILSEKVTTPILEELVQLYHEEKERADELQRILNQTTEAFSTFLEKRDHGTGEHSKRVVSVALLMLEQMDPSAACNPLVRYGFLLHDVGKVIVGDEVLLKAGPLTPPEQAVMQAHAVAGAEVLAMIDGLHDAVPIVRHHHERYDGSGYPDRLRGNAIPLPCRVFAVADAFDAMTSNRPYRLALPLETALAELCRGRGTQFDPDALDAFLHIVAGAA